MGAASNVGVRLAGMATTRGEDDQVTLGRVLRRRGVGVVGGGLRATDEPDAGATGTATTVVTVTGPANQVPTAVPTAVATADVTEGTAPLTVEFDGAGSADADGSIVAAGTDSNCDGYDGVIAEQVLVSTDGTDTATCGTPAEPCASIAHGQSRATAEGLDIVGVAAGQ